MEKKIFLVTTTVWNGTIPIHNYSIAVPTNEIAEKTKTLVIEANKNATFETTTDVNEISYYECEEDVPILNGKEQSI